MNLKMQRFTNKPTLFSLHPGVIYTDLYSNVPGIKFVSAIARSASSSQPTEVSSACSITLLILRRSNYDHFFYSTVFQHDVLAIQLSSINQADHEDSRARRGHSCCCCTESSPGGGKGLDICSNGHD